MSTQTQTQTLNPDRLNGFLERFVADAGAALHAATVVVGDRLGLYKALAQGRATSEELARRTGLDERMVREWLRAQAASGYAEYHPDKDAYALTPEQAFALAHDDGLSLPGAFYIARSVMLDADRLTEAFRTGAGFGWHEHHHDLFHGTERFFRPGYVANLVSSWIPALTGVRERLEAGGLVADVGCGHGASTLVMAQAFPRSSFVGFDYHPGSVDVARKKAEAAGLSGRVRFEVAMAKSFPGKGYDLIGFFDCLHDMGDPAGAARHVYEALAPGGAWMIVEPLAGDTVAENLNPVGRVYYAASALICTPCSQAQEVGTALGAQAGEKRLAEIAAAGGFKTIRRAAETPFNIILEALK